LLIVLGWFDRVAKVVVIPGFEPEVVDV
jgi:hypothetical protein